MNKRAIVKKLRAEGYKYREIAPKIGLKSKSMVGYYLKPEQKDKVLKRTKQYREDPFYRRTTRPWTWNSREAKHLLKENGNNKCEAIRSLRKKQNEKDPYTGEPLLSDLDVHLDHRIPLSKGGTNDITNCDILNPMTNLCKQDSTPEEFREFCTKVHKNYKKTS